MSPHDLSDADARDLASCHDLEWLMTAAAAKRDAAHGAIVSYSRKVFAPLTKLCRDACHYCTFAEAPREDVDAYLSIDAVLGIARAGRAAGCKEALFTLGDKPELRYASARRALDRLGYESTIAYLAAAAQAVIDETGLLPHVNPGCLEPADLEALRRVSISQGIMLESSSPRLCAAGGPHYGSPDKLPTVRLATIRDAGAHRIPFTTGILVGIGETRLERVEDLLALRSLHDEYGHLQEIIIQNFTPKVGTRMAAVPAAPLEEHLWTIAAARLIFAADMNIQAPPNLSPRALSALIDAGINDWGGVSPVTPDHVNPEAPWPHLRVLERATRAAGKHLTERLAIYPTYAMAHQAWVDARLEPRLLQMIDGDGWPRTDSWAAGLTTSVPDVSVSAAVHSTAVAPALARAQAGRRLDEQEITRLFQARGDVFDAVCAAADEVRRDVCGESVSYVVTRNINYTNVCTYRCQFCAFSKGKLSENLRGTPYTLSFEEIARRSREAWDRGATEVCMQGGIEPEFTGDTYLDTCRAVRNAAPGLHIHAFSPLEIFQGAATLGVSVAEFLIALKETGLGTLPGTAAEILDDEVRASLCADKVSTSQWLEVMRTAHGLGLKTTSTIMFGHIDRYVHWARHLLRLRDLQSETGGFTEFVPLPFVHMEAPIYRKGRARPGPTFREAVLMHAVGRLVLHPVITNIQTSWVKMGPEGAKVCLNAGANDLGGTLMNETITRSAGAIHGQEMTPSRMEHIIQSIGRLPRQRTTTYQPAPPDRQAASFAAPSLLGMVVVR